MYPPLWSKEAQTADPNLLSRKVVPIEEIWGLRHVPFTNSVADMREKEEQEEKKLKEKSCTKEDAADNNVAEGDNVE